MCGTDLESKYSMGVYDLQEMASAAISNNINLIVYTGGSTRWHISDISNRYNQIYRVLGNGQIERLVDNAGTGSMVDPETLISFIEWGVDNFEANRYQLIFWDHGGGSVSGYGYDTKYPRLGSMALAKIDRALTTADVQFDFIGFDACLMANTETALMLTEHADYLIASEEAERESVISPRQVKSMSNLSLITAGSKSPSEIRSYSRITFILPSLFTSTSSTEIAYAVE